MTATSSQRSPAPANRGPAEDGDGVEPGAATGAVLRAVPRAVNNPAVVDEMAPDIDGDLIRRKLSNQRRFGQCGNRHSPTAQRFQIRRFAVLPIAMPDLVIGGRRAGPARPWRSGGIVVALLS